jgi:uncharacterized membrane protein
LVPSGGSRATFKPTLRKHSLGTPAAFPISGICVPRAENAEHCCANLQNGLRTMRTSWVATVLIVAAAVFVAGDMARLYPLLPDKIASHFDAQGAPNDWSSKQAFVWAAGGTFTVLALLLCTLPSILRITPNGLINLPNKEYWLGPDQENATRQFISAWMLWFAVLVLWLLAVVFHAVMVANLQQQPRLTGIWGLLGGFLTAIAVMLLAILRRFRRTNSSATT